jgi:hypothetical protein
MEGASTAGQYGCETESRQQVQGRSRMAGKRAPLGWIAQSEAGGFIQQLRETGHRMRDNGIGSTMPAGVFGAELRINASQPDRRTREHFARNGHCLLDSGIPVGHH